MKTNIFKVIGGLMAILLLVLAGLPTIAATTGLEDVSVIEYVLDNQESAMSVVVLVWVISALLASLVAQGAVTPSTIVNALKDIAKSESFSRAEARFGGNNHVKQIADGLAVAKVWLPNDSEVSKLADQFQISLLDLYDGLEDGDTV